MIKILFLLFILNLFVVNSYSGGIKVRAREHYATHKIKIKDESLSYSGFSNTINIWYEEPFKYSFGLAMGPILAYTEHMETSIPALTGNKLRLINIGLEWKHFLSVHLSNTFYRLGLGWNELETEGSLGSIQGSSIYVGLGYEFNLNGIGIAPEFAMRQTYLEQGVEVITTTPSIGVHFYKMF